MKTLLKITHNILFKLKCILNILYTYIKSASVAKGLNAKICMVALTFLAHTCILRSKQPQSSTSDNFEAAAMT